MKVDAVKSYLGDNRVTFSWNDEELKGLRLDSLELAMLREPRRSVADWALDIEMIARRLETQE